MTTPSAHSTAHSQLALAGAAAALAVSAFAAGAWYGSARHAAQDATEQQSSPTQQDDHPADGALALANGNLSPTESITLSLPPTPGFTPRVSLTGAENGGPSGSYAQALERTPSRNGNAAAGAPALSRSSSMSSVMSMALGPSMGVGSGERPKLVVLVRSDLLKAWGKQKLAAMCMHVALAQFKKQYKKRDPCLTQWDQDKGPKVILRVPGEAELVQVLEAAKAAGLPTHSMLEPGGPSGRTRVIAALGPAPADALNVVTSQLALL